MRFKFSWLLSSLATLLLVSPAFAQTFAGPHLEGVIGWNHDEQSAATRYNQGDGLLYGFGAGYDVTLGHVVVGASTELSGATGKTCVDENFAPSHDFPGQAGRACSRDGRSVFAGARLGYAVQEHILIYALGGFADVRQRGSFKGNLGGQSLTSHGHLDLTGYRVGGGIEYALNRHAFVKAEYRFTNVDDHQSFRQNQVVTGFGYRF